MTIADFVKKGRFCMFFARKSFEDSKSYLILLGPSSVEALNLASHRLTGTPGGHYGNKPLDVSDVLLIEFEDPLRSVFTGHSRRMPKGLVDLPVSLNEVETFICDKQPREVPVIDFSLGRETLEFVFGDCESLVFPLSSGKVGTGLVFKLIEQAILLD